MRLNRTKMPKRLFAFSLLGFFIFLLGAIAIQATQRATVIKIVEKGTINPATARYIIRGIEEAEKSNAQALILQMDTPGGLDASMREIVTRIIASKVPVVVYVAPSGSRAASAGAIIGLSAHVLAMAPATNIGASRPIDISGKAVSDKVVNDAAAYARSLAKKRGKSVDWAEKVVRKAISNTAEEAKSLGIADIIAEDEKSLLLQLDGRTIELDGKKVTLKTGNAFVQEIEMNAREKFLQVIADPNVAYILMLIAIYGIIAELNNPGAIFPGAIGGISLILAFYALSVLPINLAGLLLIGLAIAMFITDVFVPSHGALTVGGIVAFGLGSFMLFERGTPAFALSMSVLIAGVVCTSLFFAIIVGTGVRSLRNPVVSGKEGLIGQIAYAKTDINPEGKVFVDGAYWNARTDGEPIHTGNKCKVVDTEGFTLIVKKADSEQA